MPAFLAGFPVNDGGMFYVMMRELRENHFIPPLYTSYNQLNIPFAYPPLALYAGAFLAAVLNVPETEILRWLPGIVNALAIPVFYLLAKELAGDRLKSAVAALAFAFTPHMIEWLSMGGGITRSFGALFMTLTALFSYRMFAQGGGRQVALTILFGSLTALSHTEATIFAVVIPVLFWMFISRSWRGVRQGLIVAAGVFIIAGSWYGFVVSRHGFAPLLSALQTGGQTPLVLLLLFNFRGITAESFLDLFGVAGFLGLILLTARKRYLIPLLYVAAYLAQPRSAHTIVNIPLAMAAGTFIVDVLLPNFKGRITLLIALASPLLLANLIYGSYLLSLNRVTEQERMAFQWVVENTPVESRFLILTGEPLAMCDSTSEWFPALTGRHSVTTAQGREWVNGGNINEFIRRKAEMEKCLDDGLECLGRESAYFGEEADYIYIYSAAPVSACNRAVEHIPASRLLIAELERATGYQLAYEAQDVFIFKR